MIQAVSPTSAVAVGVTVTVGLGRARPAPGRRRAQVHSLSGKSEARFKLPPLRVSGTITAA